MARIRFPYRRDPEGDTTTLKPLIDVMFHSVLDHQWILVRSLLEVTRADYTMLPRRYGRLLVPVIESGQPIFVRGIATEMRPSPTAYLHYLTARLGVDEFDLPVAL